MRLYILTILGITLILCDITGEKFKLHLWQIKAGLIILSAGCIQSKSAITHRVIDVVKALTGWEGVVGINAFETANSQEHPDRRAKSKKCLRVESQLWVLNGYLDGEKVARNTCDIKSVTFLF